MATGKRAIVGIQELIDRTGGAKLTATVEVNQPYAQDQHETMWYRHPRGGKPKFLEEPLYADHRKWIEQYAKTMLNSRRGSIEGWAKVGRSLAAAVAKNAPIEFGDLRNSAGLVVKEGATPVVVEPPRQPRLSEAELDAKDYMREMGVGYR